tara:strand:- start:422 stop:712 length:291 start_codon:yes stop_codon:yes gene_type:complete
MGKLLDKNTLEALRRGRNVRNGMKKLLEHVDALQEQIDGGKINVSVGVMNAEIDAGEDKVFGTEDDSVKISLKSKRVRKVTKKKAPAKKKPAAKKK